MKRREKILQAALRCVALQGPERLSIAGVASVAGVSRGTVYRYFANGDAILASLSDFIWEKFESGIVRLIAAGDARAAVMNIVVGRMDDDETRQAVRRLRELQPSYTLDFFIQHSTDFTSLCLRALEIEFGDGDFAAELQTYAEIICRVAMMGVLLLDEREHGLTLVTALWDTLESQSGPGKETPTRAPAV